MIKQNETATRYISTREALMLVPQYIVDEIKEEENRAFTIWRDGITFEEIESYLFDAGKDLKEEKNEPNSSGSKIWRILNF